MIQRKLYVPVKIRQKKQIVDGFGKEEIVKSVIITLIGLFVGVILYSSKTVPVAAIMIFPLIFGCFAFFVNIKNQYNMNMIDNVKIVINYYFKDQKKFFYSYHNIYERQKPNERAK